jgi:hypothetical protein
MITPSEQAKTVLALNRSAAVTGKKLLIYYENLMNKYSH